MIDTNWPYVRDQRKGHIKQYLSASPKENKRLSYRTGRTREWPILEGVFNNKTWVYVLRRWLIRCMAKDALKILIEEINDDLALGMSDVDIDTVADILMEVA